MVFHGDYEEALDKREPQNKTCSAEINVGDLVRLRAHGEWLGAPVGIVTDIREVIHDQTKQKFTAITMLSNGRDFTFHEKSYELVSKAERQKK